MARILVHHAADASSFECAGCREIFEPYAELMLDSASRGVPQLGGWYQCEGPPYQPYPKLRWWLERHAACPERPAREEVTACGVRVVDRRRFADL